jgi:hypothetical protein
VVPPAGAKGAATRGLYSLLGAEIEVAAPGLPGNLAFEVALELAAEIFRTGKPPAEGARLGYDRTTEFGVRYRTDGSAGAVPAVVLTQITQPAGINVGAKVAAGAA